VTLTPEQMALRAHRLGASDMAAVMGLADTNRNPLDVYMRLVGLERPQPESPQMRRGNRLEATIADWYAEELNVYVNPSDSLIHPTEDWLLATPDRIVFNAAGEMWGLEVKTRAYTRHGEWGEAGTDEVPHGVAIQCVVGMMVTGFRRWDVAAALSLDDWRVYTLAYDEETAEAILAAGRDFIENHVAKREPPPLDGSDSAHRLLAALWPVAGTEMLAADPEAEELLTRLKSVRAEKVVVEAQESELEVRLKAKIGDNAGIVGSVGKVTWKTVKSSPRWAEVAKALSPSAELILAHTGGGYRKFVPTFNDKES